MKELKGGIILFVLGMRRVNVWEGGGHAYNLCFSYLRASRVGGRGFNFLRRLRMGGESREGVVSFISFPLFQFLTVALCYRITFADSR